MVFYRSQQLLIRTLHYDFASFYFPRFVYFILRELFAIGVRFFGLTVFLLLRFARMFEIWSFK
jgi:hypothetical protein